ncbi:MAG: UMP kinase [bacterium]
MGKPRYTRVLLKLSGEVLGGSPGSFLDIEFVKGLLKQIGALSDLHVGVGIVVGGGNVLRGSDAQTKGLGRIAADYIGMLATVMNGIAMRDIGASLGIDLRVMSCISGGNFVEPYVAEEAVSWLEKGLPIVFVGGTGNPFLTTDTAAALRAAETRADVLLKATKVDGVYSADPVVTPDAQRYERITYRQAAQMDLRFMDRSALWICQQMSIPIVVFSIYEKDSVKRIVLGEKIGTIVEEGDVW